MIAYIFVVAEIIVSKSKSRMDRNIPSNLPFRCFDFYSQYQILNNYCISCGSWLVSTVHGPKARRWKKKFEKLLNKDFPNKAVHDKVEHELIGVIVSQCSLAKEIKYRISKVRNNLYRAFSFLDFMKPVVQVLDTLGDYPWSEPDEIDYFNVKRLLRCKKIATLHTSLGLLRVP